MPSKLSLIKPSIHPSIEKGESPIGYLYRLAFENNYQKVGWLINSSAYFNTKYIERIYSALDAQDWVGIKNQKQALLAELAFLHDNHLNKHFRYCPICIEEDGYWQASWHLKASVACTKHKVWLVDECGGCKSNIELHKVKLRHCVCLHDLCATDLISACSNEVIAMQLFLEGRAFKNVAEVPLINSEANELSLKQRSEMLLFFSRVQPKRTRNHRQVYKQLAFMETAKGNMQEVATTLFGGCSGFWTFLQAVYALGYDNNQTGSDRLTKFYRLFYENCTDTFHVPYKVILEEFINEYIHSELTRRNSLFQPKTIEKHPWISLQHASREYGIGKRTIRRAITDKLLKAKVEIKDQNTSVLLYKPELEQKMFRLTDVINGTEAAAILGVTKKQFKQLRDSNIFQHAISPKLGYCSTWQFSKQEIERFAQNILKKVPVIKADYMCIPEIMRVYGKKFDNLFLMIINAIESGELDAKTFNVKQGIRSLSIRSTEVVDWIESKLTDVDFYSIPQIAKLLVINQQFAYELINTGVLESEIDKLTGIHRIKEEHLAAFHAKYILLSKLSKSIELSSRSLIECLASKAIYPIDKEWSRKLRQKVYLREDIISIHWIACTLTIQ